MRSTLIFALVLTLAAVPAVQAQQLAAPATAEQPIPRLIEAPMPRAHIEAAPIAAAEVPSRHETVAAADAVREPSARTLLAVVGGVLIVIALVALAR